MTLSIDFTHPKLLYRLTKGGGKRQMIAKACGLQSLSSPTIIDACGGFGTDALVLASLGAKVIVIERHPLIFQALLSAYNQTVSHPVLAPILMRLTLLEGDAKIHIPNHKADIIYLDPMFPESRKTALHQKNLSTLHQTVGYDNDAHLLLPIALKYASYRVVVKRPRLATPICEEPAPHFSMSGKANRFDIYVNRSIHTR